MTLACVSSWGQAAIDVPGGPVRAGRPRRTVAGRCASPPWSARSTPTCGCPAPHGTIQILATHRLADFEAVGPAGSAEVAIARNLIASCDVRICLRQDTAPLAMTRDVIGLTDTECAHIASWSGEQLGRAIWKIGRTASHVVQIVLHPTERRAVLHQRTHGRRNADGRQHRPDRRAAPVPHQRPATTPSSALIGGAGSPAATVGVWLTGQLAGLLFHARLAAGGVGKAFSIAVAPAAPPERPPPSVARAAPARTCPARPASPSTAVLVLAGRHRARRARRTAVRCAAGRSAGIASRRQLRTALSDAAALRGGTRLRPDPRPQTGGDATSRSTSAGPSAPACGCGPASRTRCCSSPRRGRARPARSSSRGCAPGPAPPWSPPCAPTSPLATMTLRAAARARGGHGSDRYAVAAPAALVTGQPAANSFDNARQRADVMVTVGKPETGPSDSTNAGFFGLTATNLLAGWLHAAALTGRTMTDVLTWALDERLDEPDHPAARPPRRRARRRGDARQHLPRTRPKPAPTCGPPSMTAVAPLPVRHHARATFCPPDRDCRSTSTAFLTGTRHRLPARRRDIRPPTSHRSSPRSSTRSPTTAKQLADTTPAGRLDPPLGLILDEVANVVPAARSCRR